jgi:hypothetical protein|tara:strand:+ start:870 stop:1172 length:303 start_codon:yes stop_codon:yes gene_type:complete
MNGKFTQARKSRKRKNQDRYIDFGLKMWFDLNKEEPFTVREILSISIDNKDKYEGNTNFKNMPSVYLASRYISILPFITKVSDKGYWKIDGDKYVMDREV